MAKYKWELKHTYRSICDVCDDKFDDDTVRNVYAYGNDGNGYAIGSVCYRHRGYI